MSCALESVNTRDRTLVLGAANLKSGETISLYNLCMNPRRNQSTTVKSGIVASAPYAQLQEI